MKDFQIETAQNVAIIQNAATVLDRMLAYLIDSIIIYAYLFFSFLFLVFLDIELRDAWSIYLIVSLPAFLYYVLLETFWNGQTVGKSILKMRVVRLDGSKPGFSNYFIRWILRLVDVVITSAGLAVLMILIRGKGQRLGDLAAGTTVISEKRKITLNDTVLRDLESSYMPKYSQVTLFKDHEMQTIKNMFDDAKRKGDHNIIVALNKKITAVMEVEPEEKPIDFVSTVIKDYSYYTQKM
jgi:uncharacterized RDD family membrane protein YckC